MTAAVAAKAAGLFGLNHLSELTGKSVTTLHNWYTNTPDFFEVLLMGAVLRYQADQANTAGEPATINRDGYSLVVIPHDLKRAPK